MNERMTPEKLQWVLDHNEQIRGSHRVQISDAVQAWTEDRAKLAAALLLAHGEPPPVDPQPDYVELLKQAKAHVRASVLWKRFIEHTPLENDIAVWMADFASERASPASSAPAGQEHPPIYPDEHGDWQAANVGYQEALHRPTSHACGSFVGGYAIDPTQAALCQVCGRNAQEHPR